MWLPPLSQRPELLILSSLAQGLESHHWVCREDPDFDFVDGPPWTLVYLVVAMQIQACPVNAQWAGSVRSNRVYTDLSFALIKGESIIFSVLLT